jgi:hypothetical protein
VAVPLACCWCTSWFLAGVVVFAHHPAMFMGLFLFFLGVATAYHPQHQDPLILREGLLVAFFLAGWWCWVASSSGGCNRC